MGACHRPIEVNRHVLHERQVDQYNAAVDRTGPCGTVASTRTAMASYTVRRFDGPYDIIRALAANDKGRLAVELAVPRHAGCIET